MVNSGDLFFVVLIDVQKVFNQVWTYPYSNIHVKVGSVTTHSEEPPSLQGYIGFELSIYANDIALFTVHYCHIQNYL